MALAGIVQAVHLVGSVARTGMVAQDSMDASLRSIFVTNPDSIAAVYQGTDGIRVGLRRLKEMLVDFDLREHGDDVRYALAVIRLERGLAARPDALRELGASIARVDERRMLSEDGSKTLDETVVESLATIYEDHLSNIEPRIRVTGNRNHLQSPTNIHRIRALLLAAVRSAVLWQQVGGRRLQLVVARGKLADAVDNLA